MGDKMKILKTLMVLIWMSVIFTFSNQPSKESSNLSDSLILKTVRIIEKFNHKQYSDEEILKKFVKPVRKMAHFTIYLVLGILVFLMLKEYNIKDTIIVSLLICIIYALTDEIHQLFIVGRSGNLIDCLIDTLGSIIGILVLNIKRRYKNEKN
ncbi:MAG: VanZ family protein [Bacilli bacterium]|nr:VanZ family protein [Bacilli bacterium]